MSKQEDPRYPYTHACDYLRMFGGADRSGVRLSRSDASQLREAVAMALGMDDKELAKKLADYYLANEQALSEESSKRLMVAMGFA
jgi:hypothetical protein